MRNLKKVLALALAVVMLVGMMVVGASAAGYADVAGSDYGTAIAVVSAIEALEGSNGKFRPDGRLTRADAAVIAARVALKRNVANNLVGVAAIYSDVSAKAYYAGAVAWATNEGILSGDGNGTFRPNGSLTGYAFAKMMLGVIGYDAEIEGYQNDKDYLININFDAAQAGLLEGLEDLDLSAKMTRGQAAQMAFNAMQAEMVGYANNWIPSGNGVTVEKVRAELNKNLAEDVYDLEFVPGAISTDSVSEGYWQFNDNLSGWAGRIVGSETSTAPSIVLVGNYNTAAGQVALAKGQLKGLKDDCTEITDDDSVVADIAALTGNGVTVNLWVNAAGGISEVEIITEALATVTNVKTNRDGEVTEIVLAGVAGLPVGNFDAATETTEATEGFDTLLALEPEANTVVLVKMVDGAYDSIIGAPEMVSGKVSKKTAAGFTMDGEELAFAKTNNNSLVLGKTNYAYLDTNGYVLSVAQVPAVATVTVPNYLLITETWKVIDNSTKAEDTLHFSGITMDGTVIEDGIYVPGMIDLDATAGKNFATLWSKATVTAGTGAYTVNMGGVSGNEETKDGLEVLVAYSVNSKTGIYTFTDKLYGDHDDNAETPKEVYADAIAGTSPIAVELAGNETVLSTAGDKFFASNVEFVFAYDKDGEVAPTTKTGVVKTSTGDKAYVFTTKDAEENEIIARVFVLADPTTTPPTVEFADGIYFLTGVATTFNHITAVEDGNKTVYLGNVTAYVDGEETTLDFVVESDGSTGYQLPDGADEGTEADTIAAGYYKVQMGKYGNAIVTDIVTATKNELTEATMADSGVISIDGAVKLVNGKYYVAVGGVYYDATNALVLDLDDDAVHGSVRDLYVSANHVDTTTLNVVVLRNIASTTTLDTSIVAIVITSFVG